MVGTNSDIKIYDLLTTAGALVLTVALVGHSVSVPEKVHLMPKIESSVSESLSSLNQNYQSVTKIDIVKGFIERITLSSRDLEPEIVSVVNKHFWELFE